MQRQSVHISEDQTSQKGEIQSLWNAWEPYLSQLEGNLNVLAGLDDQNVPNFLPAQLYSCVAIKIKALKDSTLWDLVEGSERASVFNEMKADFNEAMHDRDIIDESWYALPSYQKLVKLLDDVVLAIEAGETPDKNITLKLQLDALQFSNDLMHAIQKYTLINQSIYKLHQLDYLFSPQRFSELINQFNELYIYEKMFEAYNTNPWIDTTNLGVMKNTLNNFSGALDNIIQSKLYSTLEREIKIYHDNNAFDFDLVNRISFYFNKAELHNPEATVHAIKFLFYQTVLFHSRSTTELSGLLENIGSAISLNQLLFEVYNYLVTGKNINLEGELIQLLANFIPSKLTDLELIQPYKEDEFERSKQNLLSVLRLRIGHVKRELKIQNVTVMLSLEENKILVRQWSGLFTDILNRLDKNEVTKSGFTVSDLYKKVEEISKTENYAELIDMVDELAGSQLKTKELNEFLKTMAECMRFTNGVDKNQEDFLRIKTNFENWFGIRQDVTQRLNQVQFEYTELKNECEYFDKHFPAAHNHITPIREFLNSVQKDINIIKQNKSEIEYDIETEKLLNDIKALQVKIADFTNNNSVYTLWHAIKANGEEIQKNKKNLSKEQILVVAYFQIPVANRSEAVTSEIVRSYLIQGITQSSHIQFLNYVDGVSGYEMTNALLPYIKSALTTDELIVGMYDILLLHKHLPSSFVESIVDLVKFLPGSETGISVSSYTAEQVLQDLKRKFINVQHSAVVVEDSGARITLGEDRALLGKWQGAVSLFIQNLNVKRNLFSKSMQVIRKKFNESAMAAETIYDLYQLLKVDIQPSCNDNAKKIIDEMMADLLAWKSPSDALLEKINEFSSVVANITQKINQLNTNIENLKKEFDRWGAGGNESLWLARKGVLSSPKTNLDAVTGYRVEVELIKLDKLMQDLLKKSNSFDDDNKISKVNKLIAAVKAEYDKYNKSKDVSYLRRRKQEVTHANDGKNQQNTVTQTIEANIALASELLAKTKNLFQQTQVDGKKEVLLTRSELKTLVEIKEYAEKIQANTHSESSDSIKNQLNNYCSQFSRLANSAEANAKVWNDDIALIDKKIEAIQLSIKNALVPANIKIDFINQVAAFSALKSKNIFDKVKIINLKQVIEQLQTTIEEQIANQLLEQLDKLSEDVKKLPRLLEQESDIANETVEKKQEAVGVASVVPVGLYSGNYRVVKEEKQKPQSQAGSENIVVNTVMQKRN